MRLPAALLASVLLLSAPGSRPAGAEVANLDAIAVITDVAAARIGQSLLPLRFDVDGTVVSLTSVALCAAQDDHDVDFVGLAGPDGAAPASLVDRACEASSLAGLAGAALAQEPTAAWRAVVRVRVSWNQDTLRGTVIDTGLAARPVAPGAPARSAPDATRLRTVLTAGPLFSLDTRQLVQLDFAQHRFALAAVPKFEAHRIVVELMRDEREAADHTAWAALEDDAAAQVPSGSDAVIAATHPFVGRTLAEAFAAPVEVYRTQGHVVTIHDVREAGAAGDVRASGEAVDTVSGASGTITGEYMGSSDLTLRRIDVLAHERQCSFVDLGCVANNVGLRVGSGALARSMMSQYGNSPLRPAQPLAFPIALDGRSLTLSIEALQTRSTAATLRIAGRLQVSAR